MELVVRATVVYWFLWLVVRGSGKRSLAEISPLELLLVVVIGDIVQQGVTQEDMSLTGAVLAVAVFTLWMLVGDWLIRRSAEAQRVLSGSPVCLIDRGVIQFEAINRERLTIEDVHEAARQKGFADLNDIAYVVLEPDGRFSIVPAEATSTPSS
jgi:uncharacterized membrane protein YcaP (DUF421 family)